ncbi:zinc finger, CCHC-type containing protein [Tanacetum coccineum]
MYIPLLKFSHVSGKKKADKKIRKFCQPWRDDPRAEAHQRPLGTYAMAEKIALSCCYVKVVYVVGQTDAGLVGDEHVEAFMEKGTKWRNDDLLCWVLSIEWLHGMRILQVKEIPYDLSLVQLGSHMRIEDLLGALDNDKGKSVVMTGHFKRDCRSGKKNNANAGGSGKGSKDQSQDQGQNLVNIWNSFVKYSVSLISEAFYVQVDAIAWWIDSGATTHVCKDRCWFKTFEPVEDGSVLYMGDEHFDPIHGKGSVALEFSSGKMVTLFNVLYVLKLRFGYYNNCMFMLNLNKVPDDSDSVYMSSSTIVNSSLWHARLGHALFIENYSSLNNTAKCVAEEKIELLRKWLIPCFLLCLRFLVIEHHDSVLSKSIIESREMLYLMRPFSSIPRPKGHYTMCKNLNGWIIPMYQMRFSRLEEAKRAKIAKHMEDPRTYNEAMQSRDAAFWKKAIDDEIGSIMRKYYMGFIDLPLVANLKPKGKGFDYFDTYAPVARITTIRLLLALAAIHNLVIYQMDVKTTFLNGDLDEEVYMKQPEGFIMSGNEHKIVFSGEVLTWDSVLEKLKLNTGKPVDQLGILKKPYWLFDVMLYFYDKYIGPVIAYVIGRLSRVRFVGFFSVLEGFISDALVIVGIKHLHLVLTMESEFVLAHWLAAGRYGKAEWLRNFDS